MCAARTQHTPGMPDEVLCMSQVGMWGYSGLGLVWGAGAGYAWCRASHGPCLRSGTASPPCLRSPAPLSPAPALLLPLLTPPGARPSPPHPRPGAQYRAHAHVDLHGSRQVLPVCGWHTTVTWAPLGFVPVPGNSYGHEMGGSAVPHPSSALPPGGSLRCKLLRAGISVLTN